MEETKFRKDEDFKPKGAFAFFFALIALAVGVWYYIYSLMLARS